MYALGIDLGTTYTAAAVWRADNGAGRAEIVSLGDRTAAIPSVVLLREDETFLTGEAANRRGLTEPNRVAREFKRRLGDTTPIMLGGTPHSAESLTARLLRAVVDEVVRREGGPPASVCVSHPANWGPYKTDLLGQAVRMADLPSVVFVTEPEAAATHYAQEQRLAVGAIVAVYDLGGGTFDAAVLRRTAGGFGILGKPEGIERLGGIDFDAAVFNHVRTALGNKLDELDEDDPAAIAAAARLREECVQAKEALSADTDTTIPVLLPSVTTDVRLTRTEFEAMVRPALHGSIEAMRRAVRSAGCTPEQLHSVLLVGGSSRMPLVGQLVSAELGRPVAVDTHPKHAVALGAAWRASVPLGGSVRASAPGRPGPTVVAPAAGAAAAFGAAGLMGGEPGSAGMRPAAGSPGGPGQPARQAGAADLGAAGAGAAAGAAGPGAPGPGWTGASAAGPGTAGYGAAGSGTVGSGTVGSGTVGSGTVGSGTVGSGPVGSGPVGSGPVGSGPVGSGPVGSGPVGSGPVGSGTVGSGPVGSGTVGYGTAGYGVAGSGPVGSDGIGSGAVGSGAVAAGSPTSTRPGLESIAGARGPDALPRRPITSQLASGSGARIAPVERPPVDRPPVDRPPVERPSVGPPPAGKGDRRKRLLVLGAAAAVVVLLAGGGVALAVFNGGGGGDGTASPPTGATSDNSLLPPDERCTEEIMSNPRWVCLTSAVVAGGQITIQYVGDGGAMSVDGGTHLHIYGGDGTNPPDRVMGAQAPEAEQGMWYVEDRRPAVLDLTDQRYLTAIGDAPKVCARVATADHQLVKAENGTYETGNCVPVTRTAEPTPTQTQKPKGTKTNQPHPTTTTTEPSSSTTDSTTDAPTPDSSPPNNSRPSEAAPLG